MKNTHLGLPLQSKTDVVLGTLRRSPEELSSHQRKVYKVDDHLGTAVSGLNSDGRSLVRYMRNETLNHRWAADASLFAGGWPVFEALQSLCALAKSQVVRGLRCAQPCVQSGT